MDRWAPQDEASLCTPTEGTPPSQVLSPAQPLSLHSGAASWVRAGPSPVLVAPVPAPWALVLQFPVYLCLISASRPSTPCLCISLSVSVHSPGLSLSFSLGCCPTLGPSPSLQVCVPHLSVAAFHSPCPPRRLLPAPPPGRGSISAEKPSLEHTLGSSAAPAIATVPLLPGPLSCLSKDWDFFSLHSLVSLPTCHPSMTSRRVLTRDAHFPPYRGQAHPGAKRPDALARAHPPHFPECSEHQGA